MTTDRDLAIAETCRTMVRSESEAMHRRVSWLATFQGFLFAGLGFAWRSRGSEHLVWLFAILGLTIALLVLISFSGPILAVNRIRRYWLDHRPADYDGPDILGWFPERTPWGVWTTPENFMPVAFMGAWVALLVFAS